MMSLPNDSAFRQRKHYWRKKGLSEQDAIQKALTRQTKGGVRLSLVPKDSAEDALGPLETSVEIPTSEIITNATSINFKKVSLNKIFVIVISLAFVITCSALLITATSQVLGNTLTSWCQAALLELGALSLAVITPNSMWENLTFKTTSVFLILLTLFILHNGNLSNQTLHSRYEASNSQKLTNLTELKNLTVKSLDALPSSHITKRQNLLNQLEKINTDISLHLTNFEKASSQILISRIGYAEFLIRVSLILLNILFGRLLISRFHREVAAI